VRPPVFRPGAREGTIVTFGSHRRRVVAAGALALLALEISLCISQTLVPRGWVLRHKLFYGYYQPDDDLLYKVRPNLRDHRVEWPDDEIGAVYSTDALGFRNPGRDYAASRLFFVGDSYVWGSWVPREESLCGYVEADLGEPVINLGVGSYDFPRYQKLFEDYVARYKPEIAVLGVFPNDFYLPRPIEPGTPGAGAAYYRASGWDVYDRYPLHKRTLTYRLFALVRGLAGGEPDGDQYNQAPDRGMRMATNGLALYRHRGADRNYLDNREAIDQVARRFGRIIRLSAENDVKLLVLLCPTKESTYAPEYRRLFPESAEYLRNEETGYRMLCEQARAAGVACVDLTPVFRDHAESEILYFRLDNHWNPAGNRLAAAEAVKAIRALRGSP
jgi:hypothetical protein